jgi:N-acetyltransferase 10
MLNDKGIRLTGFIAAIVASELSHILSPFDLKRLEAYANNQLDYHVILDLLPPLAGLYFEGRLGSGIRLSAVQSAILLALGLQRKVIEDIEVCPTPAAVMFFYTIDQTELQLPVSQALALFAKITKKFSNCLNETQKEGLRSELPVRSAGSRISAPETLPEVNMASVESDGEAGPSSELREKQKQFFDSLNLNK